MSRHARCVGAWMRASIGIGFRIRFRIRIRFRFRVRFRFLQSLRITQHAFTSQGTTFFPPTRLTSFAAPLNLPRTPQQGPSMPDERRINVLPLSYAASPCVAKQSRRFGHVAEGPVLSNGSHETEPCLSTFLSAFLSAFLSLPASISISARRNNAACVVH
ncbi:MAG: hypothetical protein QOF46_3372 [Paraburkholderia sp.]|nr:hypothetical protein [Paraburkholderia sp.]